MADRNSQVAGVTQAGAVGAGLAKEQAPVVETLEFGVGYRLYKEYAQDAVRIVFKRIDPRDQANYNMRVIELSGNVLRIYRKWSYPWSWGERVLLETQLEPTSAEKVRRYIICAQSYHDFDRVAYWLLTARYVATPNGAIIDNELREPKL